MKAWKVLGFSILVLVLVGVTGFLILTDTGLSFFNVLFGNEVYAVKMTYTTEPIYNRTGLSAVFFHWNLTLGKTKIPLETILTGAQAQPLTSAYAGIFNGIPVHLYVLTWVQNRVKLSEKWFDFPDAGSRQLIIYVNSLNPSYGEVHVEISGYYTLGGSNVNLSVGDVFQLGAS